MKSFPTDAASLLKPELPSPTNGEGLELKKLAFLINTFMLKTPYLSQILPYQEKWHTLPSEHLPQNWIL